MEYPSKLIEKAVAEISKLPGIGKKTALRLALHILKQDGQYAEGIVAAIRDLREKTAYCGDCGNVSDSPRCAVCSDPRRDQTLICVVEDIPDVIAVENTGYFKGLYHVLGGLISPIDGVAPSDISIEGLLVRVKELGVKEVLLALSSTMEGETTAFYITKKLQGSGARITTLARGVPVGGELEYTDEVTLGRSIQARVVYG